jgi:hypothetical protein
MRKNFFQTFVRFFYAEKNKREFAHPLRSEQKKLNFETHVIFLKLIKLKSSSKKSCSVCKKYSEQLEEEEHEIFSRRRRAI